MTVIFMFASLFLMSETSPSVEGDIMSEDLFGSGPAEERNALASGTFRWPDGRVYYGFSRFFNDKRHRRAVRSAMDEIEDHTCIKFLSRRSEDRYANYLSIKYSRRCGSEKGMKGGVQYLNFTKSCLTRGQILHYLLHTLGFLHEHQRPDRDQYVEVDMRNTKQGYDRIQDYEAYGSVYANPQDLPYDYRSVMHFPAYYLSGDASFPTITPLSSLCNVTLDDLGDGFKHGYLTDLDILRINKFYDCPS